MNQLSWTQDPEVSLARCHEGDALSTIAKKAVDSKDMAQQAAGPCQERWRLRNLALNIMDITFESSLAPYRNIDNMRRVNPCP